MPTYREAANIPVLFERLTAVLAGLAWEMIVVDDNSPDGTADVAYALAALDALDSLSSPRRRRLGLAGVKVEKILVGERRFASP